MNHGLSEALVIAGIVCVGLGAICLLELPATMYGKRLKNQLGISLIGMALVLLIASNIVSQ